MTYLVTVLLLVLAGWAIVAWVGAPPGRLERLGLAALVGPGVAAVVGWLTDVVGLGVSPWTTLAVLAPAVLDGIRRLWRGLGVPGEARAFVDELRSRHPVAAIALGLLLLVLLTTIAGRTWTLPNRLHDSITAFALLGKAIAHEGTIATDLFEHTRLARGGTYPPLAAMTFGWGEATGLAEPTQAMLLPVLGFVTWLLGAARRLLGPTSALAVVAATFLVPDLYSYVHLPLTNAFVTVYGGVALVTAASGFPRRTGLVALAAALAVWSRADAIALVLGAAVVAAMPVPGSRSSRRAGLGRAVLVVGPAVVLLVAWTTWIAGVTGASPTGRIDLTAIADLDRARYLAVESARLLANVWTMGLVIPAALLAVGGGAVPALRRRCGDPAPGFTRLAVATGVSLVAYTAGYLLVDSTTQDPLSVLLPSSYRRGITAFVAPAVLVVALSSAGTWIRTAVGVRFRSPRAAAYAGSATPRPDHPIR